jgi:hypothetical protein
MRKWLVDQSVAIRSPPALSAAYRHRSAIAIIITAGVLQYSYPPRRAVPHLKHVLITPGCAPANRSSRLVRDHGHGARRHLRREQGPVAPLHPDTPAAQGNRTSGS